MPTLSFSLSFSLPLPSSVLSFYFSFPLTLSMSQHSANCRWTSRIYRWRFPFLILFFYVCFLFRPSFCSLFYFLFFPLLPVQTSLYLFYILYRYRRWNVAAHHSPLEIYISSCQLFAANVKQESDKIHQTKISKRYTISISTYIYSLFYELHRKDSHGLLNRVWYCVVRSKALISFCPN